MTKQTFNNVAKPCPLKISKNNAFNTGTLPNKDDAFLIKLFSFSSLLSLFFFVFLAFSSVGVNPCYVFYSFKCEGFEGKEDDDVRVSSFKVNIMEKK